MHLRPAHRARRWLVVAVVAALTLGAAPARAESGAATIVGGFNADPASLAQAGTRDYDGAFSAAGATDQGPIVATDCQFTAHDVSNGTTADGTITTSGCAGDQIEGTLTYHRTASLLTGAGDLAVNSRLLRVSIVCWLSVGVYVSVRIPPGSVTIYVGVFFTCTVTIQVP